MIKPKINDFHEQINKAENAETDLFWVAVYEKAFNNMVKEVRIDKDCRQQREGVDRVILLDNGRIIKIDEKLRFGVYKDIALEYISNDRKNTPGWIEKDLSIDYLAYAFYPIKTAYLLDWRLLKRAWGHFGEMWKLECQIVKAPNKYYNTISVAVPIGVLLKAISNAGIIVAELEEPNNNPKKEEEPTLFD